MESSNSRVGFSFFQCFFLLLQFRSRDVLLGLFFLATYILFVLIDDALRVGFKAQDFCRIYDSL